MTETTPPNPAPEHLTPVDAEPAEPIQPAEPVEPVRVVPPTTAPDGHARDGHRPVRVLTAVGFLLLAGGLLYVWLQQQVQVPAPGVDPARIAALESRVSGLQQRVAQLEQRPAPQPAPAPVNQAPPPSPAPPPDLRPLEARIAALEQRPAAAAASPPDLGPLVSRIDALDRRATQADTASAAAASRADRAIRIGAAAAALAAGQPLGNFPDAPAALARFATNKPPTEADLRLAFPAAASRAAEASRPANENQSMAERMWERVASVVTVRSGNRVILGAPASVVLDAARDRLDAGDLAGAVAALDALDPGAAQAMAEWRAGAQSLLDARAALAALAHN